MDRLLSIEAFVRVAETGNFAKAAVQLGVTRSVVTHRIQQLEHFINAPLFHRSTRHVRLSEVGETYYKECADMVAGFNSLTEQMRNLRAKPTGKLRVQMLPGFAIDHFGPLLAEFTALYPDIEVDVIVNDRLTDPIEEGFDIAFQMPAAGRDPHRAQAVQRPAPVPGVAGVPAAASGARASCRPAGASDRSLRRLSVA